MFLFLRSLLGLGRLGRSSARRAEIRARLKTDALIGKELAGEARGQNFALERMLRETQEAEREERKQRAEAQKGGEPQAPPR